MKKISRLLLILAFVMLITYFLPSPSEAEIYDKVLRLHVLANSDSTEDQALKLKVRDSILEYSRTLGEFEDVKSAEAKYSAEMDNIRDIAKAVIEKEGYSYPVEVSLGYEYYPTRVYEDVSLPAGEYLSLRVMIGGAEGENWWCVLYPPLCISAASSSEELLDAGFTPAQMQIVTDGERGRYKVKFKILESAKKLINNIKDRAW